MKKQLLFVMRNMESDGAVKSLVSLLQEIDYEIYNVDLFLFEKKGLFLKMLPSNVKIINGSELLEIFLAPLKKSIFTLLKMRKYKLVIYRLIYTLFVKLCNTPSVNHQYAWKVVAKAVPKLEKKYDVAIGYNQDFALYYIVDFVKADVKIGWIHNDYNNTKMDPKFDEKYFKKLTKIVTVSNECKNTIENKFLNFEKKTTVIQNIVSPNLIKAQANNINEWQDEKYDGIRIITIARLTPQKGLDLAIEACAKLVKNGYNIRWYVIGKGTEYQKLQELIKVNNLINNFFLLGEKSNPYMFIDKADLYVQPSRFEGKSIAIDEAKILCKPIVVTDFPTVKDQIINEVNGIIIPVNADGIYSGIIKLVENKKLYQELSFNLISEKLDNGKEEIEKFYNLVEGN